MPPQPNSELRLLFVDDEESIRLTLPPLLQTKGFEVRVAGPLSGSYYHGGARLGSIHGAAIEEACELHTGALRTEPHRDRKLSAAEAVEQSQNKP